MIHVRIKDSSFHPWGGVILGMKIGPFLLGSANKINLKTLYRGEGGLVIGLENSIRIGKNLVQFLIKSIYNVHKKLTQDII